MYRNASLTHQPTKPMEWVFAWADATTVLHTGHDKPPTLRNDTTRPTFSASPAHGDQRQRRRRQGRHASANDRDTPPPPPYPPLIWKSVRPHLSKQPPIDAMPLPLECSRPFCPPQVERKPTHIGQATNPPPPTPPSAYCKLPPSHNHTNTAPWALPSHVFARFIQDLTMI